MWIRSTNKNEMWQIRVTNKQIYLMNNNKNLNITPNDKCHTQKKDYKRPEVKTF